MDESSDDYRNSVTQLKRIVNTINTFNDVDECIDFLTAIENEKVFLIVSGPLSQVLIVCIQDISQLNSVYIFCKNKCNHERWIQKWSKVKGIFTEIEEICEHLKKAVKQCDHDSLSLSFVSKNDVLNQNLNQLDPLFMYTHIFKEIVFEIEYNEQSIEDLVTYCRAIFDDNPGELTHINKFQKTYHLQSPIRWYTCESFIYSMLNRALRTLEADVLIKMAFFIKDLHRQIEQLHTDQQDDYPTQLLTVYRGQGLSKIDFEKLIQAQGGLMSFNNFLSTSIDRDVSFAFADSNRNNPELIGVLFEMKIDRSISSSPFANLSNISQFESEEEILFSMHTVFRINEINEVDHDNRLWLVKLTLTSENDELLSVLTTRIREETFPGSKGLFRLGGLLNKIGQLDSSRQVYEVLLEQTSCEQEKGDIYHQLGLVNAKQGNYQKAISNYEKALEIYQKTLVPNDTAFTTTYTNIGTLYYNVGETSKALLYHEKALKILQKTLPLNHPDLAAPYNNVGLVYITLGEYAKALSFYERSLIIYRMHFPSNYPDLSTCYNNIGLVYHNMKEYSKAMPFYEKALEIQQKALPSNHPTLATFYNNMGSMYGKIEDYSKALSFHTKAIEIRQKTLSPNHPLIATSLNNIGLVYHNMEEYSKALSYFEKALEIYEKALPKDPTKLATTYSNVGVAYKNLKEYSKAILYYEKALDIQQKTLSFDHPSLLLSYNNIGLLYDKIRDYSKALLFCQKSLEIGERVLVSTDPDLAESYNSIGSIYFHMKEYSKAISFVERAVEIGRSSSPSYHSRLKRWEENLDFILKAV